MAKNSLSYIFLIFSCITQSTFLFSMEDPNEGKIYVANTRPYQWPYNGKLLANNTALIVIDMQNDFLSKGGYIDGLGYDIEMLRQTINPLKELLDVARQIPGLLIIHTREGHRADLSDCPANKLWRSKNAHDEIGSQGPMGKILIRGERGWEIIPELTPLANEEVIDKPGKGAFYGTDLDLILRIRKIENLILTGVTTDVCVHTTMRDANDIGYECLALENCTAATDLENHNGALKMITMQGGVFGAVGNSHDLIEALQKLRIKTR